MFARRRPAREGAYRGGAPAATLDLVVPSDAHPVRVHALWRESLARVWLRRLVTVPGLLAVTALVLALLPALLAVSVIVDSLGRRPWVTVRFQLALASVLVMHVIALVGLLVAPLCGGGDMARRQRRVHEFVAWWGCTAWRLATRIYRMKLQVEGDQAAAPGPVILFARHAGLLDTLLPVVLLSARHGMRIRFVMKHTLLWDPCIDLLGHRVPTAFVRRGTRHHARELAVVERLLVDLDPRDVIVLYPEGTRFSPRRRRRVLTSLARRQPAYWDRAERLRHLLPPHPGGPLALLGQERPVDVVFCAHIGLEGAGHFRDLIAGRLLDTTVRVRFWRVPAAEVPRERDAQLDWLYAWWARMDAWIASHRARPPASTSAAARDVNGPCA